MNLGSLSAALATALPSTVATLALLVVPAAVPPQAASPVAAVVGATAPGVPAMAPGVPAMAPVPALDAAAEAAVAATNAQRAAVGAGPVVWNGCLQPFAQRWATTLAGRGSLAHQDLAPLLSGCSLSSAGENVAMGYSTASAVVTAWMNSPGHRANLLNPTFTQVTIAVAKDASGRTFWVMNLGAGQAAAPPVSTPTPASVTPQPPVRTHRPISREDAPALTPHR
ncbi:MAG: CAP domain-containing protein [Austwickia sp.]|jgi:uncharacterized protein YkwD|nr:MAG: CAP domain-containing protein [Austwickia sp.]